MTTKKPSQKRIRYLIRDERKAAAEYRRYGFKGLAKDESRHRRFLLKKLKKKSC